MTRRPATRRPPRLAEPTRAQRPSPAEPTLAQRLARAHITGRHTRMSREEVVSVARRVVAGDARTLLGLPRFARLRLDEVLAVASHLWGVDGDDAGVTIQPERTLAGAETAGIRLADVAARSGRIAFATTRPASLLPSYQAIARRVAGLGATILEDDESGPFRSDGRSGRRLRWLAGVAVVTDGDALLAEPGIGAVDELLFHLPRPDLLVGDRAFAGGALADSIETIAFADLDALAVGVAAARGWPVTMVPLDDRRPPAGYRYLLEALAPTGR